MYKRCHQMYTQSLKKLLIALSCLSLATIALATPENISGDADVKPKKEISGIKNEDAEQDASVNKQETEWTFTLGGGAFYGPKYEGHAKKDTKFFPIVGMNYGHFSLGKDGAQYQLYRAGDHTFSVGFEYEDGRDLGDLPKDKRGLGEVEGGVRASLSGKFSLLEMLSLGLSVSKSMAHHQRFSAKASLGSVFPIYGKTILGRLGISSTWNDAETNKRFYGVNDKQSLDSGLSTYRAGSGFKEHSYSLTSIYSISRPLNLSLSVIYTKLHSDIAQSPVIARQDNMSVVQTFTYQF